MIVLSLFDGMSCGQIALGRFKIDKYYASEIDKYAITVTQANFPSTVQLGDIIKLRRYLEKPELYERMLKTSFVKQENKSLIHHCNCLLLGGIDILIGGSPCQGFSFAGKRLNFDDPRSRLFFEFVKIKEILEPEYFLLENVKMKQGYRDIISGYMGVEPIEINSALVSAQNRKRLYWTNIEEVQQPEDKGVFLKDVILGGFVDRPKSHCITASVGRTTGREYWKKNQGGLVMTGRVVGRRINKRGVREDYNLDIGRKQRYELRVDGKSGTLTTVQKDNLLLEFEKLILSQKALDYIDREVKEGCTHWDFKHHSDVMDEKSATIVADFFKGVPYNVLKEWNCIREFHPIECERLQTVPDNYTNHVSNTQRYKMLGNGWTVDVVAHIFSYLKTRR